MSDKPTRSLIKDLNPPWLRANYRPRVSGVIKDQDKFSRPEAAFFFEIHGREDVRREFWAESSSWFGRSLPEDQSRFEEIVIGAGPHAAIYAANRGLDGTKLLIVGDTMGGEFGRNPEPLYYLNSRNRKGSEPGIPGRLQALNALPGCIVQASDLSNRDYQTQEELGFAVRAELLQHNTIQGEVIEVQRARSNAIAVKIKRSETAFRNRVVTVFAKRVILATGLGGPKRVRVVYGEQPISFAEFVRMGMEFPERDPLSVAVIGDGDSGKVTIEALLGQGPKAPDPRSEIKEIGWYGTECINRDSFEQEARSRYKGLGRFLPDGRGDNIIVPLQFRVREIRQTTSQKKQLFEVRGRSEQRFTQDQSRYFDKVVVCTGVTPSLIFLFGRTDAFPFVPVMEGEMEIGTQFSGEELYRVGPCSDIDVPPTAIAENSFFAKIPENSAALFRYSGRTRAMALYLKERPYAGNKG